MRMDATTEIDRTPQDVYAFVSDPANDVRWRSGVTASGLTTDGPLALGSEGYATAGKSTTRWRVTAIDPGASVDWALLEGPFGGSGGYLLEPVGDRTRFTLLADVEPRGIYRLLGPLFARLGTKQNQGDVATLKELLETEQG